LARTDARLSYPVGQPSIGEVEVAAVTETLRAGRLTMGRSVSAFEAALAAWFGVKHVVACSSGTTGLHLALNALGIGPGDEVLVPDMSYVAAVNAVTYTGATPVLVDADWETWCLSLEDMSRKVSSRTRAIIAVHVYGVPCDMAALQLFAGQHQLHIVEDAAEAFGGVWDDQPLGTIGTCGVFSFYANKVITTGEGGAVITNNDELAWTLRLRHSQAQSPIRRFWHAEVGFNFRLTEMQAAIGLVQLARAPVFLRERQRVVERYRELLQYTLTFPVREGTAPWLFTGLLPVGVSYSLVERALALRGVEVRPTFVPMHRLPMYARPDGQFPMSCQIGDQGISLPTYPSLTDGDVDQIVAMLIEVLS
jgi:perosamine synthetase